MTKIFFEAGTSALNVSDSGVGVFGANGVQTLKLKTGALNVTADSNVDKFYFDGAITDFKFQQTGANLKVFDATDKLIIDLGVQDDSNGTPLTFTDGTIKAALVGSSSGVQIQAGGVVVNSNSATKLSISSSAIDLSEKSVATGTSTTSSNFSLVSNASSGPTLEGTNITFTVIPNGAVTKASVLTLDLVGQILNSITNVTTSADFNPVSAISFNAGDTAAKQISVMVKNDGIAEGIEAYKARLIDDTGAEKATTVGTITDGQPVVNLSVNNSTVNEGSSIIFTLTSDVNAPVGGLVVPYNLNTSTATNGTDFNITPATGTFIIPAGEKAGSITVNAFVDSLVEAPETVTVNLDTTSVTGITFGNTSTSTVINDTSVAAETNKFSISGSSSANEGTSIIYTVSHSGVTGTAITVPFTISGSATNGSDYTLSTTSPLVFNVGDTSKTITVPITADNTTEGAETLIITLGTPSGDSVATGQGVVRTTILDGSVTGSSSTFNLTTAVETITGTEGNDLINGYINANGTNDTFNNGDVINAGNGSSDTLQLVVDGFDAGSLPTATITGVEIISIKESGGISGVYNFSGIAGLTKVINNNSSDNVTFNNLASAVQLVVQGNSGTNADTTFTNTGVIDLAFNGGVVGGNVIRNQTSATTATIYSLSSENSVDTIDLDTANALTGLTINATSNLTASLADDYAANTTLSITGSASKVDLSGAALSPNITTVNANSFTGNVFVKFNQNDKVADTSFVGGVGNDTVDIGKVQYKNTKTLDAGLGTDTLKISDQGTLSDTTVANISNFERLEIYDDNDGAVDAFDVSLLKNIAAIQLDTDSTSDGYILNNLSASQALNITVAGNQVVAPQFNLTSATTIGRIDTLGLTIDAGETGNAVTVAGIDAPGVELVNLNAIDSFTATSLEKLGALATFTVMGNGDVNLTTGKLQLNLNSTIDATELKGMLTVNASEATTLGMSIKGSTTQANVVTGTKQADLLTGGAGADVFVGGDGNDTLNGGANADILDGGAGSDMISGGAGADFITGGAGIDTLNGGSGDDIFVYAATADLFDKNALVDSIAGGAGLDSLLLGASGTAFAVGGSDVWTGATGIDSLVGVANTTASTITLHSSAETAGIRLVDLSSNTAATGNKIEATGFSSSANLTLIGSATGANSISGGAGADTLIGGAGSDTITAGDGADVIYTNGGSDTIDLSVTASGSTVATADTAVDSIYISAINANTIKGFGATTPDKLYFTKSAFGNIATLTNGNNYAATTTDLTTTAPTTALGTGTVGFVEVKAGTDVKLYYTTNIAAATTANSQLVVTLTGVSDTDFDIANISLI